MKKPKSTPPAAPDPAPDLAREDRAVLALLTTSTIRAAAELCGMDESTLRRWLKREDFAEAVRAARRQSLAQASTRLVSSCSTASDVLVSIAEDKEAPHSARVSAARTVLEMARGFVEIDDLDNRMRALEARAAESGTDR